MLVRMCNNRNTQKLLMSNGTDILEHSLAISDKTKYTLTITLFGIYPKELKTYVHTKNLHTDVYSSSVYNCQNLEADKMSFSR